MICWVWNRRYDWTDVYNLEIMLARIARTFETSDIHEMPEFQRKVQEMSEFFLRHQLTEKLHLHYAYAYIMKLPDT